MIYGYIRVSSDKQTVENQRFEINNFCQREQLHIDGWIEETISGTKGLLSLPIPTCTKEQQKRMESLVLSMEDWKKDDYNAPNDALESQIDEFVYELYGLNENEKDTIRSYSM